MSILDFFVPRRDRIRVENCALKRRIKKLERILSANRGLIRRQAEDRDALLAQNCRLRAQRDDALARRKRDAKGRFTNTKSARGTSLPTLPVRSTAK